MEKTEKQGKLPLFCPLAALLPGTLELPAAETVARREAARTAAYLGD